MDGQHTGTRPADPPGGCPLARDVAQLQVDVDELASAIEELAAADKATNPRPWRWRELTAEQTAEAWEKLTGWVDGQLLTRYPTAAGRLADAPVCWYRHPDVVEELSALYVAWQAAYSKRPLPTAAAEWHDRWLPSTLGRITALLKGCRSTHQAGGQAAGGYGIDFDPRREQQELTAFIAADIELRRTGELVDTGG